MLLSPAKILRFSSLGFIAGIAFLSWLDTDRLAIYNIQLFGLAAVFFVLLVAWPQKQEKDKELNKRNLRNRKRWSTILK
jgi:uncharacterized membrane protein YfcA